MNLWIETPDSSNILKYIHEGTTLSVQFKHGATYSYFDVPPEVYDEMKLAPSVGKFLATRIKGYYRYTQMVN